MLNYANKRKFNKDCHKTTELLLRIFKQEIPIFEDQLYELLENNYERPDLPSIKCLGYIKELELMLKKHGFSKSHSFYTGKKCYTRMGYGDIVIGMGQDILYVYAGLSFKLETQDEVNEMEELKNEISSIKEQEKIDYISRLGFKKIYESLPTHASFSALYFNKYYILINRFGDYVYKRPPNI